MIFVNFKVYEQGTGMNALSLVKVLEEVANEFQIKIIPVVQAADIKEIVQFSKLEVWTQHVDPVGYGAHTGAVLAEAVIEDGAVGTFLNHSERKFDNFDALKTAFNRASGAGLKTLIFAADVEELKKVVTLNPTFVSYEPPELVGSTETSVAQSKPDVISEACDVSRSHGTPLIVGAGIKSREDVKISLSLGGAGVAVASDIVKAEDPKRELIELVEGFE
jgi:triosephosphate isomerase (TIM)